LQRVAVGPRAGHLLDRKNAEGPRLVFNQHRLTQNGPHLLADNAHDDVSGAPRAERHDDFDRLRGIFILRRGRGAADGEDEQ
jgi:hypothetical protein